MSPDIVKVCILGASFNTGNMGVSMLAAGAIHCVLNRFPNARITLLDYAREGQNFTVFHDDRVVPIQLVNIRFSKNLFLSNNIALIMILLLASRMILSDEIRKRLLAKNRHLNEVMESAIVFAVSGGDSFSDIYGVARFLYVALPQLVAVLAGKRLILLPQTIGPFNWGLVRVIAKYILNHAETIYSRDRNGVDTLRTLLRTGNTDGRLRFCHDMAFHVDGVPPKRLDIIGITDLPGTDGVTVGFNVSGLLLAGSRRGRRPFGFMTQYRSIVDSLIEYLILRKGARVLLIPHVFGGSSSPEGDDAACDSIYEGLHLRYNGRIGLLRGTYSHTEIKHIIGLCDFFVGARMHACIAAVSQQIPTVPIAYSDKFKGMMHALGLAGSTLDPRVMNIEGMLRTVDALYERRIFTRSELAKIIPEVRMAVHNTLEGVPVTVTTTT